MIYIDTSSFLKLFLDEENSQAVHDAVHGGEIVVVSMFTLLESLVQIRGLQMGGSLRPREEARLIVKMNLALAEAPFKAVQMPPSVFKISMELHDASTVHCRAPDRLHLAAMKELGIRRLMTHDTRQADVAWELGYEVISPGLA